MKAADMQQWEQVIAISDWHPINTAPQYGSEIMLWIPATSGTPGFRLKAKWTLDRGWQGMVPHSGTTSSQFTRLLV